MEFYYFYTFITYIKLQLWGAWIFSVFVFREEIKMTDNHQALDVYQMIFKDKKESTFSATMKKQRNSISTIQYKLKSDPRHQPEKNLLCHWLNFSWLEYFWTFRISWNLPLIFLKVPSHQFRSAWNWCRSIGLDRCMNRGW